ASSARPHLPPSLSAAIMRCLEKQPKNRFQTAREFRDELETVSTPGGGTPASAPIPSAPLPAVAGRSPGRPTVLVDAIPTPTDPSIAASAPRKRGKVLWL